MKNIMLWARRYVTIYGIIMLCTFFMCLLFNPTSQLPVVSYFGRIMVFTLLSLLSLVVYYSRDELTPKGWWLRTVLHALLLEAMLLPLAHRWGFWHSGPDIFIYRLSADPEADTTEVYMERTFDDVKMQGEIEGLTFDEKEKRLLLLYNRGARISAGVPEGFYDGYKREISEVFTYDIEEN